MNLGCYSSIAVDVDDVASQMFMMPLVGNVTALDKQMEWVPGNGEKYTAEQGRLDYQITGRNTTPRLFWLQLLYQYFN